MLPLFAKTLERPHTWVDRITIGSYRKVIFVKTWMIESIFPKYQFSTTLEGPGISNCPPLPCAKFAFYSYGHNLRLFFSSCRCKLLEKTSPSCLSLQQVDCCKQVWRLLLESQEVKRPRRVRNDNHEVDYRYIQKLHRVHSAEKSLICKWSHIWKSHVEYTCSVLMPDLVFACAGLSCIPEVSVVRHWLFCLAPVITTLHYGI